MADVIFKMVGFDDDKQFPGQHDWLDVVYAGEDGSILVLLGRPYSPHKSKTSALSSLWHEAEKSNGGDWFQLRQAKDNTNERWYVKMRRKDGFAHKIYVHRLVAWAWYGSPKNDSQCRNIVRHLNDISSDNRRVNLKWGLPKDNRIDRESPATRQRVARQALLLEGVRIVLEYKSGTWDLRAFREGKDIDIPPPQNVGTKRRTSVDGVLWNAINTLKGVNVPLTPEKTPVLYSGWCFDEWLPKDGFRVPNKYDAEPGQNFENIRTKVMVTEAGCGTFCEYILRRGD